MRPSSTGAASTGAVTAGAASGARRSAQPPPPPRAARPGPPRASTARSRGRDSRSSAAEPRTPPRAARLRLLARARRPRARRATAPRPRRPPSSSAAPDRRAPDLRRRPGALGDDGGDLSPKRSAPRGGAAGPDELVRVRVALALTIAEARPRRGELGRERRDLRARRVGRSGRVGAGAGTAPRARRGVARAGGLGAARATSPFRASASSERLEDKSAVASAASRRACSTSARHSRALREARPRHRARRRARAPSPRRGAPGRPPGRRARPRRRSAPRRGRPPAPPSSPRPRRLALQPVGLASAARRASPWKAAAQRSLELLLHIPRRGLRRRRVGLGRAKRPAPGLGRRQRALQGRFGRVRRRHMVDSGPRRAGRRRRRRPPRPRGGPRLPFALPCASARARLAARCRLVRLEARPDAPEQPPRLVRVGAASSAAASAARNVRRRSAPSSARARAPVRWPARRPRPSAPARAAAASSHALEARSFASTIAFEASSWARARSAGHLARGLGAARSVRVLVRAASSARAAAASRSAVDWRCAASPPARPATPPRPVQGPSAARRGRWWRFLAAPSSERTSASVKLAPRRRPRGGASPRAQLSAWSPAAADVRRARRRRCVGASQPSHVRRWARCAAASSSDSGTARRARGPRPPSGGRSTVCARASASALRGERRRVNRARPPPPRRASRPASVAASAVAASSFNLSIPRCGALPWTSLPVERRSRPCSPPRRRRSAGPRPPSAPAPPGARAHSPRRSIASLKPPRAACSPPPSRRALVKLLSSPARQRAASRARFTSFWARASVAALAMPLYNLLEQAPRHLNSRRRPSPPRGRRAASAAATRRALEAQKHEVSPRRPAPGQEGVLSFAIQGLLQRNWPRRRAAARRGPYRRPRRATPLSVS